MRIVNSREMDTGTIALYDNAFIEQHLDTHLLKVGKHPDCVVISENAIDWLGNLAANPRDGLECWLIRAKSVCTIIAR